MPLKQSATDEESIKNHMHTDARDNLLLHNMHSTNTCTISDENESGKSDRANLVWSINRLYVKIRRKHVK